MFQRQSISSHAHSTAFVSSPDILLSSLAQKQIPKQVFLVQLLCCLNFLEVIVHLLWGLEDAFISQLEKGESRYSIEFWVSFIPFICFPSRIFQSPQSVHLSSRTSCCKQNQHVERVLLLWTQQGHQKEWFFFFLIFVQATSRRLHPVIKIAFFSPSMDIFILTFRRKKTNECSLHSFLRLIMVPKYTEAQVVAWKSVCSKQREHLIIRPCTALGCAGCFRLTS